MRGKPTKRQKHPPQPIVYDEHGTLRFKANKMVQYLLDHGGINMNDLAMLDFGKEDRRQFAQLIGYYDLSYAPGNTYKY